MQFSLKTSDKNLFLFALSALLFSCASEGASGSPSSEGVESEKMSVNQFASEEEALSALQREYDAREAEARSSIENKDLVGDIVDGLTHGACITASAATGGGLVIWACTYGLAGGPAGEIVSCGGGTLVAAGLVGTGLAAWIMDRMCNRKKASECNSIACPPNSGTGNAFCVLEGCGPCSQVLRVCT